MVIRNNNDITGNINSTETYINLRGIPFLVSRMLNKISRLPHLGMTN